MKTPPCREERRKVARWMMYVQTVTLLVILVGVSMVVVLTGINAKISHTHNYEFNKKIEEIVANHVAQTEILLRATDKGYRFTAGNAWQMMQYFDKGVIDMTLYPPELKTVCGTWYNTWLEEQGVLKEKCAEKYRH